MNRSLGLSLLALTLALPAAARTATGANPIHPTFAPLDETGSKTSSEAALSPDKTCGACHDAAWIAGHDSHSGKRAGATCIQCHLEGGRLELRPELLDASGLLVRSALRISTPRAANCAACHGLVTAGSDPVLLPSAIEAAPQAHRSWSLTLAEGAIISAERMSESFLNLEGKASLAAPWDVHAAKLVECVACHFAANNPARTDGKHASLRYLTADPRRQSTAEFLVRPDHRLAAASCRSCHDPLKAHAFLPYRARHMEVLSCQACHLASPRAPALEMVDATVATLKGVPAARYRNLERRPGEALNAATVGAFRPLLVERVESDGARRLAPVNPVSRWRWVAGPERSEVPFAEVVEAFTEGGRFAPAVLALFDADRDGRLDERELRLDTAAKTSLIAERLAAKGARSPAIDGVLEAWPLAHGISTRDQALRDCAQCHAEESRIDEPYPIAAWLPGGKPPRPGEGPRGGLQGTLGPTPGGGLTLLRHGVEPSRLHVLGHSREGLTNLLGFLLFLGVAAGVTVHALFRIALQKRRAPHAPAPSSEKAYVFGRYERIWHWTMALSGVVLILTGLEIHHPGGPLVVDLPLAVALHNAFAVVLVVNALLSLFYHLATAALRNFIPAQRGLAARILEHLTYQSRGIFFGGPHPKNAAGQKLNPLQQLTYLALLNVLFPLQIGTGLIIWAVGQWPAVAAAVGGLQLVAPVHNAGAWLFLSFFILHVYLVSTGRTVGEHLGAMVTGYQALETEEHAS